MFFGLIHYIIYNIKGVGNKIISGIAVFEIIGGIMGILPMGYLYYTFFGGSLDFDSSMLSILGLFLVFLSFYILITISGVLLYKRHPKGILFTKISQYIQIPIISISGFTYLLVSGLEFGIVIDNYFIDFLFNLGSVFEFSIDSTDKLDGFIGINLIPIIILYYIHKYQNNITN